MNIPSTRVGNAQIIANNWFTIKEGGYTISEKESKTLFLIHAKISFTVNMKEVSLLKGLDHESVIRNQGTVL